MKAILDAEPLKKFTPFLGYQQRPSNAPLCYVRDTTAVPDGYGFAPLVSPMDGDVYWLQIAFTAQFKKSDTDVDERNRVSSLPFVCLISLIVARRT